MLRFASGVDKPAMAIDRLSGAAKIQVDGWRTQRRSATSIQSQHLRIAAEQLKMNRRAIAGTTLIQQLRTVPVENTVWHQAIGNAEELRHTPVIGAELRQNMTHGEVGEPFHGRQNDTRGICWS